MKIKKLNKIGPSPPLRHLLSYPGCCTEPRGRPRQIYLGFRTNLVEKFCEF